MSIIETMGSSPEFSDETGIWYVHTEQGSLFDPFIEGNYIAVGYNSVTLADIHSSVNGNQNPLKTKLIERATAEYLQRTPPQIFEAQSSGGKTKITTGVNWLERFYNMKKGDIVVIPEKRSEYFAFGIVEDQVPYAEIEDTVDCPYFKRRKIKWIKQAPIREVHPKFHQFNVTRHAISEVNTEHRHAVLQSIFPIFKYGDVTHVTFSVLTDDAIHPHQIFPLGVKIYELLMKINESEGYGDNLNDVAVQILVASKGKNPWLQKAGSSLLFLGAMLLQTSCDDPVVRENRIQQISPTYRADVQQLWNEMDNIDARIDSLGP